MNDNKGTNYVNINDDNDNGNTNTNINTKTNNKNNNTGSEVGLTLKNCTRDTVTITIDKKKSIDGQVSLSLNNMNNNTVSQLSLTCNNCNIGTLSVNIYLAVVIINKKIKSKTSLTVNDCTIDTVSFSIDDNNANRNGKANSVPDECGSTEPKGHSSSQFRKHEMKPHGVSNTEATRTPPTVATIAGPAPAIRRSSRHSWRPTATSASVATTPGPVRAIRRSSQPFTHNDFFQNKKCGSSPLTRALPFELDREPVELELIPCFPDPFSFEPSRWLYTTTN